jgi:hypothetical protein
MSKRYPRSIPAPRSVFQGRNSAQSARRLLVAIQATHIATLAMNGQCGHFYDATGLSHGIVPLMAQLASLYSQLTNSKAGASSHVSSASTRLRTSLNRLLDVPTSEVPPSTRMDRDLHAPIPHKAISSPSKFYIFSTISRRAGTLDFKSQGGVQPSYTSTHLNHHLSSFYKLPTCRFPCAFCQPSIFLAHFLSNQDGTIHPLFLPISSLFYRRNHQGIRIPQDLPPKSITCHLFHFQPCPLHQDLPIPPRASLPLYTLPNNSPGRLLWS